MPFLKYFFVTVSLSFLTACVSPQVEVLDNGNIVPTQELTNQFIKRWNNQGFQVRKPTQSLRSPKVAGLFFTNAVLVSESSDDFREIKSKTFYPQNSFGKDMFGFKGTSVPPVNARAFGVYFNKKYSSDIWAGVGLKVSYQTRGDWLFFDKIQLKAEGREAITLISGTLITDRNVKNGWITEDYSGALGARKLVDYLTGLEDGTPYSIRLSSNSKNLYVDYEYRVNKPVVDEWARMAN